MQVEFRIQRFNPEKDDGPHWQTFSVDVAKTDAILTVLNKIKDEQDGTLTFRKSCAHGMCGSCAIEINGRNQLACMTLVQDCKKPIKLAPMKGARIIKDLTIDQDPFFDRYRAIIPYLVNDEPAPSGERLQSPEDHALIEESTKCILCGACTHSCPSFWADNDYLGPAALLKAYRFVFDSRDTGAAARLKALDNAKGLFKCYTIFNCVRACPKEIHITSHIAALKRKLLATKL